ncbi:MAG: DUF6199 family natural product biosynthesis protein [Lutispora sp.]|jgi:hypothetical protein
MKTLMGLILLIIGGLSAINPEFAWKWEMGWKVKNAEPSDAYLVYVRISGIVMCIVGLVLIFSW